MISRAAVVDEARSWIKTPWLHQASLKGVACDCIGLIVGVAEALGLPEAKQWKDDLRYRGYGPTPLPDKLLEACAEYLDPIPINAAALGDIFLLTFLHEPMHFAIISAVNPFYIIHGYQPAGGVVENIVDEKWNRRIIGAYRLRGVE